MITKDNSIARSFARLAIHAQKLHLVKLREFTLFPVVPGIKFLKLTTSKATNRMFSRSSMGRADGIHSKGHHLCREILRTKCSIRITRI